MGVGDEIMASGQAQAVYDADLSMRVAICDVLNRPRWHPIWDGNPILAHPEQVAMGEPVHRIQNASGCRPYLRYPFTVEGGAHFTDWRARDYPGRIYLTEAELAPGVRLQADRGRFVVVEPCLKQKANPNKLWGFNRYASVVAARPDLSFVQLMHPDSDPLPGADHIRTDSFRTACGILAAAAAYLGPEGGLHHASAVLGVRAVVLFAGVMNPETTGYPTHINLADDGPESPCGRWTPCEHCREAMDRITVPQVLEALESVVPVAELAGGVR